MKFRYSKLLGRIKEVCETQENLAIKLGMSPVTMCVKLKNKSEFRQREIFEICNILGIPKDEIGAYFFAPKTKKNLSKHRNMEVII